MKIRMSRVSLGSLPYPPGRVVVLVGPCEFIVDAAGAEGAMQAAALLIGAAEYVRPKGYRLELPLSDTDLAAPVEMEREAEEMENKRRRG